MVFSSLVFLCIFLPTVFLLYCVIPSLKAKNALLIVASLVFYAYGEPIYVLLMIFSSLLNYLCARWVTAKDGKYKKSALVCAVAVNIGVLAVFKYSGMFVSTLNSLLHLKLPVPEIALPIGISFFTFQALSYVIDVYRGTVDVQKNYFHVLLYISFFPQLIAGPIVKYRDIHEQIADRHQDREKIALGFRRFICGLMKKVLIANTMGHTADIIFGAKLSELNALSVWLGAICYIFQIYYDFSGYSDMAIGLAAMFGFDLKENFNYPYGAKNIQDFWRKWHISLSTWFKEYLYIPLGGNRKGKFRTVLNRLIVFFFTGLWHGANWTFVLWGMWHGLFLILEEYIPALKKLPKGISNIYTMMVVTIGFVMFRADSISYGFGYIAKMFTGFSFSASLNSLAIEQLTPYFIIILIAAVAGCAPIKPIADKCRALQGLQVKTKTQSAVQIALFVSAVAGLLFCIIHLAQGGYNPFIYFRF